MVDWIVSFIISVYFEISGIMVEEWIFDTSVEFGSKYVAIEVDVSVSVDISALLVQFKSLLACVSVKFTELKSIDDVSTLDLLNCDVSIRIEVFLGAWNVVIVVVSADIVAISLEFSGLSSLIESNS